MKRQELLNQEPIHVLSLGAGVQSSTLALMAARGEVTPNPIAGIFADTKREPKSVYTWLDFLETQLPFPIIRVTAGDLATASLKMKHTADGRLYSQTNIPFFTRNHDGSMGRIKIRGCTRDFKLKPITQEQRRLVGPEAMLAWRRKHKEALRALAAWQRAAKLARKLEQPVPLRPRAPWDECQADPLVIFWVGISLDEIERIKDSRVAWAVSRWPLIEMRKNRANCLDWLKAHGFEKPPKSACKFCPFHDDDEWRRLRDEEPLEFEEAAQFEEEIQRLKGQSENFKTVPYLHRSLVPLRQVDFSTETDRGQLDLFSNECEGMCGV